MKKVLNALLLLVLLGAVLFVGWKAKLIPNPFDKPGPTGPTPVAGVQREELRVAVAQRPEKLMVSSLKRLLEVEGLKLKVVEYNPETVWLQLASQELDMVVVPLGEAVQGQGRFNAGSFLFFTGLSEGLDQLLAAPDSETPKQVAVQRKAATDFLARQMLPEAKIVPAASLQEAEQWLIGRAVQAALIDTSANSPDLGKKFKTLKTTSAENPMPTVAVISRHFAENAADKSYDSRREVLFAALKSWANLVGYLETQPELLKTNLKKEAQELGVDIDRLLAGYQFLAPGAGRQELEDFHNEGEFKKTLDLLVLSGVANLSAPNWEQTVQIPSALAQGFSETLSSAMPEVQESPTVVVTTPETPPTPAPSTTPAVATTPSATESPVAMASKLAIPPTFSYPQSSPVNSWPEPIIKKQHSKYRSFPPALSRKYVAAAAEDYLYIQSADKPDVKVPVSAPPTTMPVSDGRHFYLGVDDQILAVNTSGKTLWKKEIKGSPYGANDVYGERLLYAIDEQDRGRLVCLDAIDGELLWEVVVPTPFTCSPAVGSVDQTNYVVGLDQEGNMWAWNFDSGEQLWKTKLDEAIYISPAAGYGKVATTSPRGKTHLYDLSTGKVLWNADLGNSLSTSPTVTPSGVLVPAKDTYLYSLGIGDGAIRWKTRLATPLSQPAVVVQDTILQASEDGKIHTIKTDGGAVVTSAKIGSGWVSRPVFRKNRWSVLDDRGSVAVYEQ